MGNTYHFKTRRNQELLAKLKALKAAQRGGGDAVLQAGGKTPGDTDKGA